MTTVGCSWMRVISQGMLGNFPRPALGLTSTYSPICSLSKIGVQQQVEAISVRVCGQTAGLRADFNPNACYSLPLRTVPFTGLDNVVERMMERKDILELFLRPMGHSRHQNIPTRS